MSLSAQNVIHQSLLLDIEVNEKNHIYSIGAVFGDSTFEIPTGRKIGPAALEELDLFGRDARFVLGHNILSHDIPRLKEAAPDLHLFSKPRIDTLFLSPSPFPPIPIIA